MSSPAASNSGAAAADDDKKPLEQITFRFCSECSNMLYPKEDEAERKLLFTCRTCSYSEESSSSCIFRNVMNTQAGATAGVTQDVASDPTVGAASLGSASTHLIFTDQTCSSYLWCACCGNPVMCGVCDNKYATVVQAVPCDDMSALSWSPSEDEFADFLLSSGGSLEELVEEEDEDEAMGVDSFNKICQISLEPTTSQPTIRAHS